MDLDQSDLGPHCLPVCKNRFEKFARRCSRRHKQTTFSEAGFLGVLRVKTRSGLTLITANLADDKLMIFVSYFSQKLGFSISCNVKPISREKKRTHISKCRLLIFSPTMLSFNSRQYIYQQWSVNTRQNGREILNINREVTTKLKEESL